MKIFNRAIEPNHHHISLYKKAIENLPDSLKDNTTFDVRNQTFEEYTQEESSGDDLATKFDLVHFSQTIYYVDPEQTLKHCFEKELQGHGQVVVLIEGRDLITATYVLEHVTTELEIGKPPDLQESFNDEVIKMIHNNGWKLEVLTPEYEIDVTEVFDEDSIQGNLLLDFFTLFVNFRTTADKANIDKVLSVMKDKTIVRDGKRWGKKVDVVLVISK